MMYQFLIGKVKVRMRKNIILGGNNMGTYQLLIGKVKETQMRGFLLHYITLSLKKQAYYRFSVSKIRCIIALQTSQIHSNFLHPIRSNTKIADIPDFRTTDTLLSMQ